MDSMYVALAVMGGIFFGLELFAALIRWGRAVRAQARGSKPGVLPSPSDRVALCVAAIVSPAPWLLCALGVFAYNMLTRPHDLAWDFFFGTLVASQLIVVLFSLVGLRRAKKRSAALTANAANAPQDAETPQPPLKASTPTSPPTA